MPTVLKFSGYKLIDCIRSLRQCVYYDTNVLPFIPLDVHKNLLKTTWLQDEKNAGHKTRPSSCIYIWYDNYMYNTALGHHYFQPPLTASRVLLQPSIQASLSNAPCKTELKVFFWLAGHACKSAQTSFFSRNFSPFTRTRGMYCRTSFLHCQHENKI